MKTFFSAIIIASCWFLVLPANTIRVLQDQPSIQAGINAAVNGDTVLVSENIYYENISFKGKRITVASHYILDGDTSHIVNTIINGSQPSHPDSGSVVFFLSGEDTTSILNGFTITGGSGTVVLPAIPVRVGGGVVLGNSGKIINNIIEYNHVSGPNPNGGGLSSGPPLTPSPYWVVLENNKIRYNSVSGSNQAFGGALEIETNAIIRHNQITDNTATTTVPKSYAPTIAGIYCSDDTASTAHTEVRFIGNLIARNKAFCHPNTVAGAWGSLHIWGPKFIITGNTFLRNEVTGGNTCYGVAVDVLHNGPGSVIDHNLIAYNESKAGVCIGGGIRVVNANPLISNNIIVGNKTSYGAGIALMLGANPLIINNTIFGNKASLNGAGIYSDYSSHLMVRNTIVWADSVSGLTNEIFISGGNALVEYSNVMGGWSGNGNMNSDPLFLKSESLWFCLNSVSPCADAGDPDLMYNDPEDPLTPGYGLWPAQGTTRNDIGAFGGPGGCNWNPMITNLDEKYSSDTSVPSGFQIFQNYPNPFNPITNIEYRILNSEFVTLEIYNVLGQRVATLVSEKQKAGFHSVEWDASRFASGIYLYRFQAGEYTETRKMLLLQ